MVGSTRLTVDAVVQLPLLPTAIDLGTKVSSSVAVFVSAPSVTDAVDVSFPVAAAGIVPTIVKVAVAPEGSVTVVPKSVFVFWSVWVPRSPAPPFSPRRASAPSMK